MKNLKIWSLIAMFALLFTACDDTTNSEQDGPTPGPKPSEGLEALVNEWAIISWCGDAPVFNVYIDFNEDGTFEMYQQVYSLDYELYTGKYNVAGDVVTGTYSDGSQWKCGYRASIATKDGDYELTLMSQEDVSLTSVYSNTAIPEDIKAEATATRSSQAEPFL